MKVMNRRDFLKMSAVAACYGVFAGENTIDSFGKSNAAKDRPNIIFLLTDDQRGRTFSAAGHPIIKKRTGRSP